MNSFAAGVPVDIGNRVWLDSNGNGLQDAEEPGIKGVTVHLYNSSGKLSGTAITDANGKYAFSVSPDTDYTIKLDNPADYTTGPLKGDQLTVANSDCEHLKDSRAVLPNGGKSIGAGNYPQITVVHLAEGKNAYSFNVGFTQGASKSGEDNSGELTGRRLYCSPFPPEDKPTRNDPTPTEGSQPVVTPTADGPKLTPTPKPRLTPTPAPKKPTPTSGPKKPTSAPINPPAPTKFPKMPPTGSNPTGLS